MEQQRDSLKEQLADGKESLESLDNAVGSNLEARFCKCQFELASNKIWNQQDMAIKPGVVQEENPGLKAHIERLKGEHVESGFETLEPSHATMKRKAMDALYRPETHAVKMMRLATDTYLDLAGFRAREACEISGNANNEVLRVAARAGLLSIQHFSTGPNGTLGLTEFGAKKVAILEGFRYCLGALENGEKESAELAAKARNLMSNGGFWQQGHRSLLPLKDLLNDHQEVTLTYLMWCISEMRKETAESLVELLNAAKTLNNSSWAEMTTELTETTRKPLRALCSKYEDGKLSASTNFMLANGLPGRPRLAIARSLFDIAFNYFDLFDLSKEIMENAKLPPEYASPSAAGEELARSLVARKRVSSEIDMLLADIDEEY